MNHDSLRKGTAPKHMWPTFLFILLLALTVYFGFGLLYAIMQPRLVYYPMSQYAATPDRIGLAYETVSFTAADGVQLSGWFIPAAEDRGVILFFHGNAGNISHRLDSLAIFHRLGLSSFIIDYRGYGKSAGRPSEAGTYRDAEAAWKYLVTEQRVAPDRIVIFGRSLGGAVGAWLAARYPARACILESTFTSAPDMAALLFPLFPARLFCRYQYNALKAVQEMNCPLLVAHSPEDDIIPYAQGRRLFEAAKEPKFFLVMQGDHNSGFLVSGEKYVQGLADFFAAVLDSRPEDRDRGAGSR